MKNNITVCFGKKSGCTMLWLGILLVTGCAHTNGESFYQAGRYQAAAEIFIKQAEQGDIKTMHRLAAMYTSGKLGKGRDYQQAVYWYQQAASRQDVAAMLELGLIYEFGLGDIKQDDTQAAYWYRQAADYNHVYAQYRLGHLLAQQQNNNEAQLQAYQWMLIAQRIAEQQRSACRQPLWCRIVTEDLFNYRWQLAQQLTTEQRQAAQQVAARWGS